MGLSARAVLEQLTPIKRRELDRFILDCMPNEACGLVLVDRDGTGAVACCSNVADDGRDAAPDHSSSFRRHAYALNPMAIVDAEKQGSQVVGIWHSHVGVGAYFSDADVAGALIDEQPAFPGVDYVVFDAQHDGVKGFRVFRYGGDASFIEVGDEE